MAVRTPVARRPSNSIVSTGFAEPDVDAEIARRRRHALAHRAAAAERVPDAELVFEKGEEGEQARAAERRHAEVFGLEREGETDPGVAEIAG